MVTKRYKSARWYGLDDLEKRQGPMSLGRFIKAFRECEEVSQAEYARRLGISKANLCDIEKGRKLVSIERAIKFSGVIGVPETVLVQLSLQDQLRQANVAMVVEVHAA